VIGTALSPRIHVSDSSAFARVIVSLAEHYDSGEIINVGSGEEVSIKELAETVAAVVGLDEEYIF
jgi:dTDP-D-glucose 4,6-dehydratase